MNKSIGGLGRGLGSLIPQQVMTSQGGEALAGATMTMISEVVPSAIVANPHQPRKTFAEKPLNDLIASVREHGILQPLVVTDLGGGQYELIAGERRLRAAREVGLERVPVYVRSATDQQKLELAIIENVQRHDLTAVEEAHAMNALIDNFSLTQGQVADRLGKSRPYVANTLRLLDLDESILGALTEGKITRSHARTLLQEKDHEKRSQLFDQMLNGGMTVREAEARAGSGRNVSDPLPVDPNVEAIETGLRETLGTKVHLKMKEGRGKLVIHFYSKEELRGIVDRLK
ncbi:MAG: ParB/RepB/Spo0J family partition protein [bacterium]|nr:ParB/RepB/Spo0J family partition protein [bacterium]